MDFIDEKIDLERALDQLPERQREMLLLWASGYTQEEIAGRFGVSQQTVSREIIIAIGKTRDLTGTISESQP